MIMDIEGGFCAAACDPNDPASMCPPAPEGTTASSQCAFGDGMGGAVCGLICTVSGGDGNCPTGMACQDFMDPMYPDTGVCTWP